MRVHPQTPSDPSFSFLMMCASSPFSPHFPRVPHPCQSSLSPWCAPPCDTLACMAADRYPTKWTALLLHCMSAFVGVIHIDYTICRKGVCSLSHPRLHIDPVVPINRFFSRKAACDTSVLTCCTGSSTELLIYTSIAFAVKRAHATFAPPQQADWGHQILSINPPRLARLSQLSNLNRSRGWRSKSVR